MMKVAYSPTVSLIESHVGIYKIYVLRNPLKGNEIFYVGQTMKRVDERLSQHIAQTGSNRDKISYIKQIIDAGSRPVIESVEVIKCTCYIDKMAINERELYWIRYYKELGCNLLNSTGMGNGAKCHEYHGYLSSLKKGETSWHYYYCGKTAAGHEVYDVEKLKADGFEFKEPPPPIVYAPLKRYVPWENQKFLIKSGLPITGKDKVNTIVKTEVFPEQPQWSIEFRNGIVWAEAVDQFDDGEDCDYEYDIADYEQDTDAEPEESDNDEYLEESLQAEIHDLREWEKDLSDVSWGVQLNGCIPNIIPEGIPESGYRGNKKYKL